jgi:hypothetical protein
MDCILDPAYQSHQRSSSHSINQIGYLRRVLTAGPRSPELVNIIDVGLVWIIITILEFFHKVVHVLSW